MKKSLEIEFKYKADELSLSDFHDFCKSKNPEKYVFITGHDHFYKDDNKPESFFRYRVGSDGQQLTWKQKTVVHNSYVRIENNIDIKSDVTKEHVDAFCSDLGYEHSGLIFKNAFIYNYDNYTLVYYVCFNDNMTEIGRFIEIEMKEGIYKSESKAWSDLIIIEKLCKPLGAFPINRVTESLFELYGRNDK